LWGTRIPLGDVSVARISCEISVGTSVIWTDPEELKWTCISKLGSIRVFPKIFLLTNMVLGKIILERVFCGRTLY
jgi:hypothetical protein